MSKTKAAIDRTIFFHERLEPIMEFYREDTEKSDFGALMFAVLEYSMYGKETTFEDRTLRRDYKSLVAAVDVGRESLENYRREQFSKITLRYATSENDVIKRCKNKGLSEEETQSVVDRYNAKQNKDSGLTADGQFPPGTPWEVAERFNRGNR